MDVELDPNEVLSHLKQMGYHNITGLQLKEFIKDLRKLILYEQRKQGQGRDSTLTSSAASTSSPSPEVVNITRKSHKTTCSRHRHKSNGNNSKDADISSSSSDSNTQVPRIPQQKQQTVEDTSKSSTVKDQRHVLQSRENLVNQRSKSSFIRPRELTGQRPGSAPQKSDPVALYHHYKQLWKQQKLPGEESHSGLRWTIREKMMGQESQPRVEVCGCCCKCDCLRTNIKETEFTANNPVKNMAEVNKSQETMRIRGPYTLDGQITGFKNEKIKERKVLGTFEIYDRISRSVEFYNQKKSLANLSNYTNKDIKTCYCHKLKDEQSRTCYCHKSQDEQSRTCYCHKSQDEQSRTCYCHKSQDEQRKACYCHKSQDEQSRTCYCHKSQDEQYKTCDCCLILNKPEEKLSKIKSIQNEKEKNRIEQHEKHIDSSKCRRNQTKSTTSVWVSANNGEVSDKNVDKSTLADHVRTLLHMERNFTSDLITPNASKKYQKEIEQAKFKKRIKNDMYKIHSSDRMIFSETSKKISDILIKDAFPQPVTKSKQILNKCRHTTVCDCEEDEITYVTLKSNKNNGSRKIVVSTEITKHK